jgi:DNA polymerase III alpha subunit
VFDHKTIKSITKRIPQQDKVSDKMEEQNEKSLIRFVLKNFPDTLKELGQLEGDTITGEHAYYLEQAIRLEGLNSNVGIHASGILISDIDVVESCPLIINNDGDELLCAFEMSSSEKAGLVKVDILATEVLDKCMEIQNLLLGTSEDQ